MGPCSARQRENSSSGRRHPSTMFPRIADPGGPGAPPGGPEEGRPVREPRGDAIGELPAGVESAALSWSRGLRCERDWLEREDAPFASESSARRRKHALVPGRGRRRAPGRASCQSASASHSPRATARVRPENTSKDGARRRTPRGRRSAAGPTRRAPPRPRSGKASRSSSSSISRNEMRLPASRGSPRRRSSAAAAGRARWDPCSRPLQGPPRKLAASRAAPSSRSSSSRAPAARGRRSPSGRPGGA